MTGTVRQVNTKILDSLLDFIPVISPVGGDEKGNAYNINADLVAGSLAGRLGARLIMLTNVPGIKDAEGRLITSIKAGDLKSVMDLPNSPITDGMRPKVEAVLAALSGGAQKVSIIDGTKEDAILSELFTDKGNGTEIVNDIYDEYDQALDDNIQRVAVANDVCRG